MNRIEKEFELKGLKITDENKLPKEQRKIGNIGRLISAARAAESAFNEEVQKLERRETEAVRELAKSQHELADAERRIGELTAMLAESQQRLKSAELRNKVETNDFTQAQQRLLLDSPEVAAAS